VVLDRWSWSVFGCGFKPIESLRGIPGVPFSFLRGRGPSALRPGAGARGAGITAALSHVTVQVATSSLGPLRFWARALLTTPCCYGCSEQASAAAAGARLVAWTSRSDSWNETGASHVPRHVLRQAPRTAVKDNQGRRQDVLPRRHGHDRTTSWPDSPRGSLTAPLAASGVLPICPLPIWAFCISRCQSACSSPTAHGSSCTCVAESITHATYNRPESVPGPHSVRQSVYEKNGPKLQVATCSSR
jgi:hypothetical protein